MIRGEVGSAGTSDRVWPNLSMHLLAKSSCLGPGPAFHAPCSVSLAPERGGGDKKGTRWTVMGCDAGGDVRAVDRLRAKRIRVARDSSFWEDGQAPGPRQELAA